MRTRIVLCLFGILFSASIHAAEPPPPDEFIRTISDALLERLDGQREALKSQPEELRKIIEDVLVPLLDFRYASRLVLGVHARRATPEQLKRFEKAFYEFLIGTYAKGLVNFTGDRVNVLPFRGKLDPRRTVVKTQVFRDDGTPVPVDYSLRWTKQGWKAYDVMVEGISYITNYRNSFNTEINQNGLDAVIERMEEGILPGEEQEETVKEETVSESS
ncbi:MAG: ABC transporter substrate-binding protein [Gammaproteobacteria bacterium]|nr:ABC transporter substrate-binding protein [Gammaproteobacteria bacterium]